MRTFSELNLNDEDAKKYIRVNRCAECNGTLSIKSGTYWNIPENIIRCIRSAEHQHFGRPYRVPTERDNRINITRSLIQMENDQGNDQARAVTVASMGVGTGVMTRSQAREILLSLFPGAPELEVKKAEILCADYNLNPLRKHIFLIPYKNKDKAKAVGCNCDKWPCPHPDAYDWSMQMGIGANRQIVGQYANFSYIDDTPRVMSDDEQKKIRGKVDPNNIWAIVKLKNPRTNTDAVGYGCYPRGGYDPKGVLNGNSRENMAFIRAERQALDRLCPGKLPTNVEVMDETLVDLPAVNTETGEIIEGKAEQLNPSPAPTQTPTSGAVNTENPVCPTHGVQLFPNKWGGFSHAIEGELNSKGKQAYCTWKLEDLQKAIEQAKNKPVEGEVTELPPEEQQATPAPQDGRINQQDDESGDEDTGREIINNIAKKLWPDDWQVGLRNFLKKEYGLKSRNAIKDVQIHDILKKLNEMVAKMQ